MPLKTCKILLTKTKSLQTFNTGLIGWDNCRELVFTAYTSKVTPESNLARVIHAGWKNRGKMGQSCLFNVRDSLLLESRVASLSNGMRKRTIEKF